MPQSKTNPTAIKIEHFQYTLPDDRIARFPLNERDQSKLLIYKNGKIDENKYKNIADYLPKNSLLLFNRAKVVHARLHFKKSTGGKIEIFCLEPDTRYGDISSAMMQENEVYWKCLLRGASKWKNDDSIYLESNFTDAEGNKVQLKAEAKKVKKEGQTFTIHFSWKTDTKHTFSFSEFLEEVGKIPIPPYLKRKAEESDEIRYQTIFAEHEGSVAAPTAALHFTDEILKSVEKKNILTDRLTLHVGAGTFMPVKSEQMKDHEMHAEWIEIPLDLLKSVKQKLENQQKVVCIGTTSARTLESAYWIGVQVLRKEWKPEQAIAVSQWYPYENENNFTTSEVIEALIAYFKKNKLKKLITRTKLIIAPGYDFKFLDGIITNFHQPASTLLLMISALVGNDWRKVYDYALANNFRFLSYGDGSLLWKNNTKTNDTPI